MHIKHSMLGKFLVHAWSWCGGLNEELLYWFIEGQIHFDLIGMFFT